MTDPHTLLAVCASLKPAPGRSEPSACRELLRHATGYLGRVVPGIGTLDLREAALPGFEGLLPQEHPEPQVRATHTQVARAKGLILSVPAYWGGVGSTFKAFVEVMCGPAYADGVRSPFEGKPVVSLLVGSDPLSAREGASQLATILAAVGARQVAPPVVVPDPAAPGAGEAAVQALIAASAQLAQAVLTPGEPA
ncbi:NAD(P)H-dependent oxidoreductase [Tropicibacter sp. S64]|uniref:NAD(P)H-dependent oxidoreductase n=1 Tax=Tropicibacter sp. S64 TaxID=3415122 RepID=UPI003C7CD796